MNAVSSRAAIVLVLSLAVRATAGAASSPTSEAPANPVSQLKEYLEKPSAERPPLGELDFADRPLTRSQAQEAQELLWEDHAARIRRSRAEEMESRKLTTGELSMPFFYTVNGKKPDDGRSLYISLHGGGGTTSRANDRQWNNQKRLYRIEEGVYLAPRAPTNTWNLWHQAHIDDFFDRLIENLIVFENVDPNRVYLLGYSAGGDGVYQLAPRMADRFAAAAMMAGHPNEASPLGLRNLPFTLHVGGKDSAYKRNQVARQWSRRLERLQEEDPEGYVHWCKIHEDRGHWMGGKESAALPWMARHTRDPFPDRVIWRQDDVTHRRFYWLAVRREDARRGVEVRAALDGQRLDVRTDDVDHLLIRINDRMLDLDENVIVTWNDEKVFDGHASRTIGTLAKTLAERGDPESVFSAEVPVQRDSDRVSEAK